MTSILFLSLILSSKIYSILFDCNSSIKLRAPNFTLTEYFIRELYEIEVQEITSFNCSGSQFNSIAPSIFKSMKDLTSLNLSNNRLSSLALPPNYPPSLSVSGNYLGSVSTLSTGPTTFTTLNLSSNLLTNSSTILTQVTSVKKDLDLSSNYLSRIPPSSFLSKGPVLSHLNLSKNFFTAIDENLILLLKKSKNFSFCPQVRNVACRQNSELVKDGIDSLKELAGKVDVSCLTGDIPLCGEMEASLKPGTQKVGIKIVFPDQKKVFIKKILKLKFTSNHFKDTIIEIPTSKLKDNTFNLELAITQKITGDIDIEVEQIENDGHNNPLRPNIAFFIIKGEGKVNFNEKNKLLAEKLKKLGKVIERNDDHGNDHKHRRKNKKWYYIGAIIILMIFAGIMIGVLGRMVYGIFMKQRSKVTVREFERIEG